MTGKPKNLQDLLSPSVTAAWSQGNPEQMLWSRGGEGQWLLLALSLGGFTLFLYPLYPSSAELDLTLKFLVPDLNK